MSDISVEIKPVDKHSVKKILTEALDTIVSTYWVKSAEYTYADADALNQGLEKFKQVKAEAQFAENIWEEYDEQVFGVELIENDKHGYSQNNFSNATVAVTGVCTIGAISLATVTLYDVPLQDYDSITSYDKHTDMAGRLVAEQIVMQYPHNLGSSGAVIANWNDLDETTREQVIDAFQGALANPVAEASEVWMVKGDSEYSLLDIHRYFATKVEAEAFLAQCTDAKDAWESSEVRFTEYEFDNYTIRDGANLIRQGNELKVMKVHEDL